MALSAACFAAMMHNAKMNVMPMMNTMLRVMMLGMMTPPSLRR
jgi:biopolymer transport protein ExbD